MIKRTKIEFWAISHDDDFDDSSETCAHRRLPFRSGVKRCTNLAVAYVPNIGENDLGDDQTGYWCAEHLGAMLAEAMPRPVAPSMTYEVRIQAVKVVGGVERTEKEWSMTLPDWHWTAPARDIIHYAESRIRAEAQV